MIETFVITFIIAKIKRYKLKPLIKCWIFYPIIVFECIYIFFEINIFMGNYEYISIAHIYKKLYLYMFLIPIIKYRFYIQGVIGSVFIIIGTLLNNVVIYANRGKMPVFPTLSYITGYVKLEVFEQISDIHILGEASSKLILLSDYIDLGYSILSIGDVLIRVFVGIVIYYTIYEVNKVSDSNIYY